MKLLLSSIIFLFSKPDKTNVVTGITTLREEQISLTVQLILIFLVFIIILGFIFFSVDQWSKHSDFIKKIVEPLKKNYFIIFLLFPVFYLIYYYSYYLPYRSTSNKSLWVRDETAEFLLKASLTILGTGVLTGSLKWLNNLAFFKKQFAEIIKSEEFSNVLSEKMKELALSDNYLLQRNDLEEIWKRVTLCKYEQKFPELASEIQKKLENDLFVEQSLMYYYKNFRLQINLVLDGDIIKITEITSLTVISATTDKIELNFATSSPVEDTDDIYTKLIADKCKSDGNILALETKSKLDETGNIDPLNTQFSAFLEGKKKYTIERQIEMTQDMKNDRVYSFSASRLIEGLSINIKFDENLDIFFSPVGKNAFPDDNHLRSDNSVSYINRDLLLPGEKFKVFIFRKTTKII